jgi:hypothetical protein
MFLPLPVRAGYACTAVGALVAGHAIARLHNSAGYTLLEAYRTVFLQYGCSAVLLMLLFAMLGREAEAAVHLSSREPAAATAAAPAGDDDAGDSGVHQPLLLGHSSDAVTLGAAADVGDDVEAGSTQAASAQAVLEPVGSFPVLLSGNDTDYESQPTSRRVSGFGPERGNRARSPHAAAAAAVAATAAAFPPSTPGAAAKAAKVQAPRATGWLGLSQESRRTVAHLSLLFGLDSFAGGLITGTLLVYYFQVRRADARRSAKLP